VEVEIHNIHVSPSEPIYLQSDLVYHVGVVVSFVDSLIYHTCAID